IYHLLGSDPERGAYELENLDRMWSRTAHPADRYALAAALSELEGTQLVHGRALVWAWIVCGWTRVDRGELAQLPNLAAKALDVAKSVGDRRAEGETYALLGDTLRVQGTLTEAKAAFQNFLEISLRLAEQEPTDDRRQVDLAAARVRVGDVLNEQGNLPEAQSE